MSKRQSIPMNPPNNLQWSGDAKSWYSIQAKGDEADVMNGGVGDVFGPSAEKSDLELAREVLNGGVAQEELEKDLAILRHVEGFVRQEAGKPLGGDLLVTGSQCGDIFHVVDWKLDLPGSVRERLRAGGKVVEPNTVSPPPGKSASKPSFALDIGILGDHRPDSRPNLPSGGSLHARPSRN